MKYRFTLRTLLLAIAFFSCLVACLFLPGGIYLHLPLMVMYLLVAIAVRAAVCLFRDSPACGRIHRRQLVVSAMLLTIVSSLYFPFFGIALRRARSSQFAATQRALLSVGDSIAIRDAAWTLHQQVINLHPEGRRIDGNSDALPNEIASLRPRYVWVRQESVFVDMCCTPTDWFGLCINPEGIGEREWVKLADGIWYWEAE